MTDEQREIYSIHMAAKAADAVLNVPDVVPHLAGQELMVRGYAAVTGVPIDRARVDLQAIASAAMREASKISIADKLLN